MNVQIVTPQGKKFTGTVSQIEAPTVFGDVCILPGHQDMLAALGTGTCTLAQTDGDDAKFLVDGGYLQVTVAGKIVMVTERAETTADIDLAAAQQDLERYRSELNAAKDFVGSEAWTAKKHSVDLATARIKLCAN
jgi:F-type H+-transporting ATPase subunit epsilon